MDHDSFLYHLFYVNWHPLIKIKRGDHEVIIRALRDDKGQLYGNRIIRFDVVVDGVTGPDADSLDRLLEIFRDDPVLRKYLPLLREAVKKIEPVVRIWS